MYRKTDAIAAEELDFREFIALQNNKDAPLIKLRFLLDTTWIKRDFDLDLIVWNLSEDNLERTKRILDYVLKNFGRLFETGWTALYHDLCDVDPGVAEHTLEEFFTEQVNFDSEYYTIQLELNCDHQNDGEARYCFVVATASGCDRWMIADDNMRVYMNGNKPCGLNDNNDDTQMAMSMENSGIFYGMGKMLAPYLEQMERDGFLFAEPFDVNARS